MGIGSEIKKRNARLKGIFLLLAVFTMAATVCLTVIFVLTGIKEPTSLLKFPRTWYVVLSFVLFALWTGAVVLLVRLESCVMKQKSKGLIALASIINGAALSGLLLSLILSAVGFSGKVGIIAISSAEELSYIRNYPSGKYVMTQDIDMNGEEWKSIPKCTGSINGNSHCILHITIGKDGFIEENLGKISSLTLSGVRYMAFEPGKEFGTLVKINRGSVLSCGISPADGKADHGMNVLVGCNYGICQKNIGICRDRCQEHTYQLVASAPASLFKPGADSYLCKVCGDTYTSVAVYMQPLKLIVSIVLLLAAVAWIIIIASSHKKQGYMAAAGLSIVALFMAFVVFSYQEVGVNAGKRETWIDRWLADEAQLEANQLETNQPEANQLEANQPEGDEHAEYDESNNRSMEAGEADTKLDWKALDDYAAYTVEPAQVVDESEENNSIGSAAHVNLFSTVVGNLSGEEDVDFYSFTIAVESKMTFQFRHQGSADSSHWDGCLYGSDGFTVLKEGYIASEETSEFESSELKPGTYYLKISRTAGMNPLLYSFSDAEYAITFVPVCVEHLACTQYVSARPTCTEPGEVIRICDDCGTTVSRDAIEPEGHTWGEWRITKEATWLRIGERTQTCLACGKAESEEILTFVWVMPFMILVLVIMIRGFLYFWMNIENRHSRCWPAVRIALLLFLSATIGGYELIQTPLGLSRVQVNLALGAFGCVEFLLIIGVLSTIFTYGRHLKAIVISVFVIAFLFLARTLLVEKYALALAILFGAMALLNVILAYVAYSKETYKWMAFAIAVSVTAAGLTISFGMNAKRQIGAVPMSGTAQVQTIQEREA